MSKDSPKKIVDISFRKDGRIYAFYTGNFVLNKGDKVIMQYTETSGCLHASQAN